MATYPVEFHRRLEQKWKSRIEQIFSPPIQSRWPGSRFDHSDTSLCLLEYRPSGARLIRGQYTMAGKCMRASSVACRQVHMVNPKTSKVLGADEETN